jgi:hypothetical protein
MKKNHLDTVALAKRLKKLADRRELLRLAMAAFAVRTQAGGFEKVINAASGWPELSPVYAAAKAKRGQDSRRWVRTGRTLRALTQGRLQPKESNQKGARVRLSRNGIAVLTVSTFGPQRGAKPAARVQEAILFGQEKRRPLMQWKRGEMKAIQKMVADEIAAILRDRRGG